MLNIADVPAPLVVKDCHQSLLAALSKDSLHGAIIATGNILLMIGQRSSCLQNRSESALLASSLPASRAAGALCLLRKTSRIHLRPHQSASLPGRRSAEPVDSTRQCSHYSYWRSGASCASSARSSVQQSVPGLLLPALLYSLGRAL